MDYKDKTDEELALLAKSNTGKPLEELLSRYVSYIEVILSTRLNGTLPKVDSDDLIQECLLTLYSAIEKYDGKSNFKAYACACINNKITSSLRSLGRKKNEPMKNYVPLTGYGEEDVDKSEILIDSKIGPEDLLINKEKRIEMENIIKQELSDLEFCVFVLHGQGYSYDEIAKRIGESKKVVDNAMQRVRKKLGVKFGG